MFSRSAKSELWVAVDIGIKPLVSIASPISLLCTQLDQLKQCRNRSQSWIILPKTYIQTSNFADTKSKDWAFYLLLPIFRTQTTGSGCSSWFQESCISYLSLMTNHNTLYYFCISYLSIISNHCRYISIYFTALCSSESQTAKSKISGSDDRRDFQRFYILYSMVWSKLHITVCRANCEHLDQMIVVISRSPKSPIPGAWAAAHPNTESGNVFMLKIQPWIEKIYFFA